jgi:hypothetical protein
MAAAAPRLVVRTPDGVERVIELRQGAQVIGHATDSDVRIEDEHTAAHHAELTWDGAHLLLRDLGSGVGTTVNGRAVIDWVDLRDGDNIRFGMAEGRVETPSSLSARVGGLPMWLSPPSPAPVIQTVGAGRSRRVFISHASEDKRSAKALANWLERRGWEPWIDESGIPGGSAWAASIQAAIKESAVMVLLVTSNSVAKDWVLDEVTSARNLRIPVIPAVLERVRYPEDLQFMIQRTQSVDIAGFEPASLARLDSAILDVLERQGRIKPHRSMLRIGQVLEVVGTVVLLGGFVGFILAGFSQVSAGSVGPDFEAVLTSFFIFMGGGVIAATGASMVRSARSKGV